MHLVFELSLKLANIFFQLKGFVFTLGNFDYDGGHHSPRQDYLLLGRFFTDI